MSTEGGTKAVIAALLANSGIAPKPSTLLLILLTKFYY
jgi:hypothetical protein